MAGAVQKTHGMSDTKIYGVWTTMKARCYNKNNAKYKNYGERGIIVCDRWLKFENFWEDVKFDYKEGLTIDRIDVNGNYEPSNCRWITNSKQQNNKTYTDWVEIDGEKMCMKEALIKYDVTWKVAKRKLGAGFTLNEVFIEKKFLPSKQQHWFELEGELIRLKEACEKYNIKYKHAQRKLYKGLTPEQIFIERL